MQSSSGKRYWYADPTSWLLVAGVGLMFGRTFYQLLTTGLWTNPEFSHGPIILAVALFLLLRRLAQLAATEPCVPAPAIGLGLILAAAVMNVAGVALGIIYLELGSFVLAVAGVIALQFGLRLIVQLKFPLLFCCS